MVEFDYDGIIMLKKQELFNANMQLANVKTEEEKQKLEDYKVQIKKDLLKLMVYRELGDPIEDIEKGRGR